MTVRKRAPGICRIERPSRRTYGFSARLRRQGRLYAKFFSDGVHGGRRGAFEAAQRHYRKLLRKHGVMTRQLRAQLLRRKSSSGMVGVQKMVVRTRGRTLHYWRATWSPRPNVVRRKRFSVQQYGARRAKVLAVQARSRGVQSMVADPAPGARRQRSQRRKGKTVACPTRGTQG